MPEVYDFENNIVDEGKKDGRLFVVIEKGDLFDLHKTFDCGQCFRFDEESTFDERTVRGVAGGRSISITEKDKYLTFSGSSVKDYIDFWGPFLSLDENYKSINSFLSTALDKKGNEIMKNALDVSAGIRILRQDAWETLISFIISQNNNIPRIKKIISALCEKFGEKIEGGHSFPSPEVLAKAKTDDIFALRTGFRAEYISDASRKVYNGEIDFEKIRAAGKYEDAEAELLKIKGVGPKVAACTLLFGFHRLDAFPVDVWMKKVISEYFPDGLEYRNFGKYAGIAQQYLFYMERYING